ncbi:hypothetical protein N9H19_01645, partial [Flavobacteriales bacterium]|nr:hypothetical protein [Flavobacteriales bacterium]
GAGFGAFAIRFRAGNNAANGFVFENNSGILLSSIRGSDGLSYFRGNVGIGTTAPQETLDVVGNGEIGTAGEEMHIGDVGHPSFAGIAHKGSATSGGYALIQNANGLTLLNSSNNQPISFRRNNTEVGRFHLNGNFGIGVTNPLQRLHVSGNAIVTGLPAANGNSSSDRIVTVDGSGNLRSVPSTSFGSSGPSIAAAAKVSSTGVILNGSNVASATRVNNDYYQVNFSTAMPNANYIIQLTVLDQSGGRNDAPVITYRNQTTTGFRVYIGDSDNGESDLLRIASEFMLSVISF